MPSSAPANKSVCPGAGQPPSVMENGVRKGRVVPTHGDCQVCGKRLTLIRKRGPATGWQTVYLVRSHTQ
jgi:hypothetical protein